MTSWLILILAGLCEVGFSFCLGRAGGSATAHHIPWMIGFAAFYALSAVLLARATKPGGIPIGTAYPVWTGIGAAGAVLIGIFVFREQMTFWKMFFLLTLIGSVIGLRAVS